MADLLSRDLDPTGIMSLLTPFVTGGAIAPPAPGAADPQAQAQGQALAGAAATPAWLAFARTMGQAAQPRYGPAPPIGPALADAMSAGYGTALQAEQLPLLRQSAALSLAQREMALQQQQFEFGREQATWNAFRGMLTPGQTQDGTGAPGQAPVTQPASGFGPPATTQALAQLPDIQSIADPVMRQRVIATAADQGMSAPAAAQWARQLRVESGGQQFGPDGTIVTSPKGALGVGQVMPATFTAMQKAHPDITGDINDPGSNLKASGYYFNQGLQLANGSLPGAAVYYNAGPDGLTSYLKTGQAPNPETADYLVRSGALGAPPGAPGGTANALGPMVQTPLGAVPQQIMQQAQFAGLSAPPGQELGAYRDVIQKWQQGQVVQVAPGVQQKTYTGELDKSAVSPSIQPLTGPLRNALAPGVPADIPLTYTIGPDGTPKVDTAVSARVVQAAYQRPAAYNEQVQNAPAMQQLIAADMRAENVLSGLSANNRVGDQAAIESFAKVFDPSAAFTEGKLEASKDLGGWAQRLQNWWSQANSGGDSGLPPATRTQIANYMIEEMKNREAQVAGIIDTTRANYAKAAPGSDPTVIGAGWQPQWITPDDKAMTAVLPAGTQPGIPVVAGGSANAPTWTHSRVRPGGAAATPGLAGGSGAAPPAAAPATPPAAAPTTTATPAPASVVPSAAAATPPRALAASAGGVAELPPPGQVTPQALRALPQDTLRAAGLALIGKGRGKTGYSDQELGMIAAAIRAGKQ